MMHTVLLCKCLAAILTLSMENVGSGYRQVPGNNYREFRSGWALNRDVLAHLLRHCQLLNLSLLSAYDVCLLSNCSAVSLI